jgi:hypothetical protein
MRRLICLLLLVCIAKRTIAQFDIYIKTGLHGVGFELIRVIDHSRPYRTGSEPSEKFSSGRPIHVYVWYPTKKDASKKKISFGDYAALSNLNVEPWQYKNPTDVADRVTLQTMLFDYGIDSAKADEKFNSLMHLSSLAIRDAAPATGKFPLVIIGNGLRAGGYLHTLFAEFLASHGYVTITVPSLGITEGTPTPFDLTGIDMQINDLRFALNAMYERPYADLGKLSVAAWSAGGVSTALLQMQNQHIRAVVSLDGATGYQYGFEMIALSPTKNFARLSVPYLHFHGSKNKFPVLKNFQYYDSVRADAYQLEFTEMDHYHFTSIANLLNQINNNEESRWKNYSNVLELTLDFLNAYVKSDGSALARLRDLESTKPIIVKKK